MTTECADAVGGEIRLAARSTDSAPRCAATATLLNFTDPRALLLVEGDQYPLSTSKRSRQRGEVTMVRRATSRPQGHLPWRRLVGSDDAAGNPLHCHAAHAAHAAVPGGAVEHQSGLVPCQQLVPGKRIGGGYQVSGAVRTYLKRSQVAAFGLPGV